MTTVAPVLVRVSSRATHIGASVSVHSVMMRTGFSATWTGTASELLAEMKRHYDTVIFDSPPILPVADGLVLAQQLDGVLVVVRAGQTSRHALRHALRSLTNVEAPILGMVLNYQTHKKGGGYGYSYGYGYGYGYRSKETEAAS